LGDAGDNIFIAKGLDTIDASNVKSWGNQHSYVFETNEVLNDLFYLFKESLGPNKRRLSKRKIRKSVYWSFKR